MGTCCGRGYESQEVQLEFWKAILWNEQDEKDKFNRLEEESGTQKHRHNDTHPKSPLETGAQVTEGLGGGGQCEICGILFPFLF